MSADQIPEQFRVADFFSHIDMGFLNRRLAMSALGPVREEFIARQKPGSDHMAILGNDHLLVTMLIDICTQLEAPTLAKALALGQSSHLFMSTEQLAPCPDIYDAARVIHSQMRDARHG